MGSTRDIQTVLREQVVPAGGSRHGLVVGIESYHDSRLNLRCAGADARAVYELMTDPECGMFPQENVRLLLDADATRENVWRAFSGLRRSAGENDTVWVYYAGHAAPEESHIYWVTHDADVDDLYGTGLANDQIAKVLDDIRARQLLVLLDCCHAAASSIQKNPTRAALTAEEVFSGYQGKGRITLSSSDGKEKSVELSDVGHGAFTYFLQKGLRGEADRNGDGVVSADELWDYLHHKVTDASQKAGNRQTPILMGQMTHDLALTLNPAATRQKKSIALAIEALIGLGDERLTTEEASLCLEILRRGARTRQEQVIAAEMENLAKCGIQVATFKMVIRTAVQARVAQGAGAGVTPETITPALWDQKVGRFGRSKMPALPAGSPTRHGAPARAPRQQLAVGIDLGTTFSLVAYLDATNRPVTVPNRSGNLLTRSALLFCEDDAIVGEEALRGLALTPELCVQRIKRHMGESQYDFSVGGVKLPVEVISAFILERLKKDAERQLGPIGRAVITVPYFFDDARRRATQEAGRIAGLEVLDIINEPVAAALAYSHSRGFWEPCPQRDASRGQRILVYDLGGGTFDVTILEIDDTQFRVLASDGDVMLGGADFDDRLVDYLAETFRTTHGIDPREDLHDRLQMLINAEEAKHALSSRSKVILVCSHAGVHMRKEVTREEYERMTCDLVQRTIDTTELAMMQAGVECSQIDHFLLVGGATRMPMVRDALATMTGSEPECCLNPDQAVAHGAALYAGMLMQREASPDKPTRQLVNVNSHGLGVIATRQRTHKETNVVLIPRNMRLPTQAVRTFKTAQANQRSVKVPVVEGDALDPMACSLLGECVIRDLPPGLPRGTPVEVAFRYAANGRVSVSARVPSERRSAYVEIKRSEATDLDDLGSWRARLFGGGASLPGSER